MPCVKIRYKMLCLLASKHNSCGRMCAHFPHIYVMLHKTVYFAVEEGVAPHLRMITQETHSTTVSRANRKQAMTSPFLTLFGAAVSQTELS